MLKSIRMENYEMRMLVCSVVHNNQVGVSRIEPLRHVMLKPRLPGYAPVLTIFELVHVHFGAYYMCEQSMFR